MPHIEQTDQQWKNIIAEDAASGFEEKYPNLLACFDAGKVFGAIGSYFRLEGLPPEVREDYMPGPLIKATEKAFLILLERRALDGFVKVNPLPAEAQEELDCMAGVAPTPTSPVEEKRQARESQAALEAEVVKDYRSGMSQTEFKRKWMTDPARRVVYEAVAASGRV